MCTLAKVPVDLDKLKSLFVSQDLIELPGKFPQFTGQPGQYSAPLVNGTVMCSKVDPLDLEAVVYPLYLKFN